MMTVTEGPELELVDSNMMIDIFKHSSEQNNLIYLAVHYLNSLRERVMGRSPKATPYNRKHYMILIQVIISVTHRITKYLCV